MPEKRTQQPILVTQFEPGCYQGRVLDRGVIHRVVHERKVKAPNRGFTLCQGRIATWTYNYIEYQGEEWEVRWSQTAILPGDSKGGCWTLQLHGDEKFISDPAKMVQA